MAEVSAYKTCSDKGEAQQEYLKALDFADTITDSIRLYNCCRAHDGWNDALNKPCTCGLAFPSKLWMQQGREEPSRSECRMSRKKWRWRCEVAWQYLVEEADKETEQADIFQRKPEDMPAVAWINKLQKAYGDMKNWPQIGCMHGRLRGLETRRIDGGRIEEG